MLKPKKSSFLASRLVPEGSQVRCMQRLKELSCLVEPDESGMRLDVWLSRRFPVLNRQRWQERIDEGFVLVDGKKNRASRRVNRGETIRIEYLTRIEPEVNKAYSILYQDDALFVVNKPANLPVHPSGIYYENTLHFLLKEAYAEFYPVHRIDRETSGILVYGLNRQAARKLQASMQAGETEKRYRVIVEGEFPASLFAEGYLGQDRNSVIRKKRAFYAAPSPVLRSDEYAKTEFTRLALVHTGGGTISHLEARIFTGRMHQIRATLFSLGFPVVGDRLYGVDETIYLKLIHDQETELDRMRLRITRTALHSYHLTIRHPASEEPMDIVCPMPDDMMGLLG